MTADSNASALDMGLDTALQYADVAPTNSMRCFTERICANVIEKALGATKASTVTKCDINLDKNCQINCQHLNC